MLIKNENQNNQHYATTFGMMKKSQFKGPDLLCVNMFKAPIEKFNSNSDLQNWADKKLTQDIFSKAIDGRTERAKMERNALLKDWKGYIRESEFISKSIALIAMTGLFGKLSPKTDDVPPPLDEEAFEKTIKNLPEGINFSFEKAYLKNLKENLNINEEVTKQGWIKIPSKEHDEDNYEENLLKLKLLSADSWCTKSTSADRHLQNGDFYIYFDNNKPKVALRLYENELAEIEDEKNDFSLPYQYIDEIKKCIADNNIVITPKLKGDLRMAESNKKYIDETKIKLAEDIKNKNYPKILKEFGINMKEKDGKVTLDTYHDYYGYKNFGIDVNDMLKNVVKIEGNACFAESANINMNKLEEIGGYASFAYSKIKSLPALKRIGDWANFEKSYITNLDSLEQVDGNLNIDGCDIECLPKLKVVNGNIEKGIVSNTQTPLIK